MTIEGSKVITTWSPIITGLLTLFGVLIGVLATIFTEWIRSTTAHKRERESRKEARQDKLIERRNDFQRQTLLDLQDVLFKLLRASNAANSQDLRVHTHETWTHNHREEIVKKVYGNAQRKSSILVVRVRDEGVRKTVGEIKSQASFVMEAKSLSASRDSLYKAMALFNSANERIGEIIRELDEFVEYKE